MKALVLFLTIVGTAVAFSLLLAFPIKWCWNYAIAPATGCHEIGVLQAWCIGFLLQLGKGGSGTKES